MITPKHLRQIRDVSEWQPPAGVSTVINYKPKSATVFVTMTTCCAANWVAITETRVGPETFAKLDREAEITLNMTDKEHAQHGCQQAEIAELFIIETNGYGRDQ